MPTSTAVARLRSALHGSLLTPDSDAYDASRAVFNGMVNKHPALIAVCAEEADVVACVRFATESGMLLSVRGGGHNMAGKSVVEGGLMVDCSRMKQVSLDVTARKARAQSGVNLGEFDRATQQYGLATTLGVATTTGIAGLTLGGGYGWLGGKFGLACDNLLSAKVVTADGVVRECSATQNEALFWGLRGAGANFGIVTELEYRLHPLTHVLGGPVFHPLERRVVQFYREFAHAAVDELTLLGAAMTGPGGVPAFATVACWCGAPAEGERVLRPLRQFGTPIADLIQVRPYLEMQKFFDAANVPGRRYYNKAHNLSLVADGAIDCIIDQFRDAPSPGTSIALQQLHGAAARVAADATAFPHRHEHHVTWINPIWDDAHDDDRMLAWGRRCWHALRPFADRALYVNALEDASEEGERPVREAYGCNYDRLQVLKREYDPRNLFRLNSNVGG